MDDFLQNQINQNCKIALPEGLKDLMSDISREVLRVQSRNLYKFISDYLAALLVTREHLSIASRVCSDVCDNIEHPSLDDELKEIGLKDEELEQVKEIVSAFFESGEVQEDKLLLKLLKETNIEEYYLPAIHNAIKNAYLRYQLSVPPPTLTESDAIDVTDDVTRAVKHTLMVYEKTAPSEEQMNQMSTKIQAAYRGYGVRRHISDSEEYLQPLQTPTETSGKSIRFTEQKDTVSFESDVTIKMHYRDFTVSTSSLAGSYVKLPYYKPYSVVNQGASDIVDVNEKQRISIDYIDDYKHQSDKTKSVKIGFDNLDDVSSNNTYDESDGAVAEFNGAVEEADGFVGYEGSIAGRSKEYDANNEYVGSQHSGSMTGEIEEFVTGEPSEAVVPGSKALADEPEYEDTEIHEYNDNIHNVTTTSDRTISPESDIDYEDLENHTPDPVDSDFVPEEIASADQVLSEGNDLLTKELFEELGSDS